MCGFLPSHPALSPDPTRPSSRSSGNVTSNGIALAHAPCAQRAQPRSAISSLPCWLASRPACGLTVPSTVVPLPRPFLLLSPMPIQREAVECEREREVHGQVQQVLHAGGRTCRAQTAIAYRGLGRHGQSLSFFPANAVRRPALLSPRTASR
jgi:hypothetical protein